MRITIIAAYTSCSFVLPALSQESTERPSITQEQRDSVSDKRTEEIKKAIEVARKRQDDVDRRNTKLWERWTFAVCIGCNPAPARLKVVHTNPHRGLMGIPAALDDERNRRGQRI